MYHTQHPAAKSQRDLVNLGITVKGTRGTFESVLTSVT